MLKGQHIKQENREESESESESEIGLSLTVQRFLTQFVSNP